MYPKISSSRSAFTLIELLTVIAVIAILAAILIPLTGKIRTQANMAKSVSNLRQMGNGILLFAQDNNNVLVPPGYREDLAKNHPVGKNLIVNGSWYAHLNPYVDQRVSGTDWEGSSDVFDLPGFEVDPSKKWLRGYGMNQWIRSGDTYFNTDGDKPLRMNQITFPGETILISIRKNSSFGPVAPWEYSKYVGLGENGPTFYGGKGTYLFADLSARSLTPEEVEPYFKP